MRTIDYLYVFIGIMLAVSGRRIYSDYKHKEESLLLRLYFYLEIFFVFESFLLFIFPRFVGFWDIVVAIVYGINTWRGDKESKIKIFSDHWITFSVGAYIGSMGLFCMGIELIYEYVSGDPMTFLYK